MPELPEVETVRRVLSSQLKGKTIEDMAIRNPDVIAHPSADGFSEKAVGRVFRLLKRRGKFLIAELDDGSEIVIHLRMTGCLLLAPPDYPGEKHTHVVFRLSEGNELRFSDTRRFGRLWLIGRDEEDIHTGIGKLGPEPEDITAGYLQKKLGKSRKAIKECLMDQSVIAGIGNIYSDEILFKAGIKPTRPACALDDSAWQKLSSVIPELMSFFTEKNTISNENYLRTKGKDYRNTPYIQIYGHEGEPCPICRTPLIRTVISGRNSTYCPRCQE